MAKPDTGPVAPAWKAVGGFFRVFDIAFFLPGAILLLGGLLLVDDWAAAVRGHVLAGLGEAGAPQPGGPPAVPGWLAGLALAVTLIVLVFVSGLLCHALARLARAGVLRLGAWQWERVQGTPLRKDWPLARHPYWSAVRWLFCLEGDQLDRWTQELYGVSRARDAPAEPELLLYFWNMATLCWNVAAAFVLVGLAMLFSGEWTAWDLLPLVPALLLSMLGSEFRYFWEKEKRKAPPTPAASNDPGLAVKWTSRPGM